MISLSFLDKRLSSYSNCLGRSMTIYHFSDGYAIFLDDDPNAPAITSGHTLESLSLYLDGFRDALLIHKQ